MNEETFNLSLRRYLKRVGITTQRHIEDTVRQAVGDGRLAPDAAVGVTMTLRIDGFGEDLVIEGSIDLA